MIRKKVGDANVLVNISMTLFLEVLHNIIAYWVISIVYQTAIDMALKTLSCYRFTCLWCFMCWTNNLLTVLLFSSPL